MYFKETSVNDNRKEEKLGNETPYKDIKFIEKHIFIAISFLVAAIILILFGQPLIAGSLIIVVIALGVIILKKNSSANKKHEALIASIHKSDEKKNKIISDFSHKIREPLNNLVITENILIDADINPRQKEFLETVNTSIKSMVRAVNELTMSVAECMDFELRKQIQFNIQSTIEHVIELYEIRNRGNLDFEFIEARTASLECIGDPVIIKQIFIDLFGRIEKQSGDRKTKIKVSLSIEKELLSEIFVVITIETDTKMLIIDETDTKSSARLISLMKGKYIQKSDDDSGIIDITLCIKKAFNEAKEDISSIKIEELIMKEKKQKELKDLRVLLIEDNIINSKIVFYTLNPLVQSIDLATNGKEALEMFSANNYDMILMDIQLPVMSGLTAMEKIRALESTTNRHVPIIAITANAMIGDKEKCLSAGADDYISKPFQPLHLVERMKHLISA